MRKLILLFSFILALGVGMINAQTTNYKENSFAELFLSNSNKQYDSIISIIESNNIPYVVHRYGQDDLYESNSSVDRLRWLGENTFPSAFVNGKPILFILNEQEYINKADTIISSFSKFLSRIFINVLHLT